ncbi:MAG: T9SS type A sorting domain-containing protein [Candidatus Marinimicrobia bacterium]|nr:T9SS type A sorting domain-containing protein [bacterium]MCG2715490.1 T9SS type A sorting domain-containing protein [Candidatus Neomarinimicrobiota bacterium]
MFDTEQAIYAAFDKTGWLHHVLKTLLDKKLTVIERAGKFHLDLVETGGGAGNSSQRHEYEYVDKDVSNGITYWYKLEDLDFAGNKKFHKTVSATPLKSATPTEFHLYPNYPNPFNPVTTISYDLPEKGHVELIIYNIRGERVKTLIKGFQEGGSYQLNWDGRDQNSEILSSGIYLLQISTGKYLKTNKMVFIR